MKVVGGDGVTYGGLDRRSNRLARGLVDLGIAPGDRVAIVCCDAHAPDLLVGYLATEKLAAVADLVSLDDAGRIVASVILACAEGVAACRTAGVRGVIVGDGEGVVWWKALELRHSPAPLARSATAAVAPAALPVSLENGGLLHAVPLVEPARPPHRRVGRPGRGRAADPADAVRPGHVLAPAAGRTDRVPAAAPGRRVARGLAMGGHPAGTVLAPSGHRRPRCRGRLRRRARGRDTDRLTVRYGLALPTIHMAKNWEPPP